MSEEKVVTDAKQDKKGSEVKPDEIIPKARLDAEVARRHEAEKKLEALSKSQEEAAKAALVEQNKFKELSEMYAPKAAMHDEMEVSIKAYFAEETSDLTDEQKALIPDVALHKQLAWVKKAKAAGVFGTQNTPDKTFTNKPKVGLQPDKWFLEIKSDDPRFESLTGKQYAEWKTHNRPLEVKASVRGGF